LNFESKSNFEINRPIKFATKKKMYAALWECEFLRPLSPYSDLSVLPERDVGGNKRARVV
jgi:hypothetical protein